MFACRSSLYVIIYIYIKKKSVNNVENKNTSDKYVPDVQKHVQHKSPQLLSFVRPVYEHAVHRYGSGDRSPHVTGRDGR